MTLGCFLICLPAALAFMAPCTVAGRIYSPHTDPSLPTAHPSSSEPLSSPAPTLCSCRARTHPAGLAVFVRCRCLSEWLISPPQAQVPPQILQHSKSSPSFTAPKDSPLPSPAGCPDLGVSPAQLRAERRMQRTLSNPPDTKLGSVVAEQPLLPLITPREEPLCGGCRGC